MKKILIGLSMVALLSGCGRVNDTMSTTWSGYSVRCIEGTKYVIINNDTGVAATPLVDTNGKPKGCVEVN
jgi:uncharacterized protein YceK